MEDQVGNWNHAGDISGRFRGGKTAAQRKDEPARKARQQERGAYSRWCQESASAGATTASASLRFPWGACNGKKTRALRNRVSKQRAR